MVFSATPLRMGPTLLTDLDGIPVSLSAATVPASFAVGRGRVGGGI